MKTKNNINTFRKLMFYSTVGLLVFQFTFMIDLEINTHSIFKAWNLLTLHSVLSYVCSIATMVFKTSIIIAFCMWLKEVYRLSGMYKHIKYLHQLLIYIVILCFAVHCIYSYAPVYIRGIHWNTVVIVATSAIAVILSYGMLSKIAESFRIIPQSRNFYHIINSNHRILRVILAAFLLQYILTLMNYYQILFYPVNIPWVSYILLIIKLIFLNYWIGSNTEIITKFHRI